jgi:periplasmic protein TonB
MVEITTRDMKPPTSPVAHAPASTPAGPHVEGPSSDNGLNPGSGNGNNNGDEIGGPSGGTIYGYYAGVVGDQVRAALARDPRTHNAKFHVKSHIYFETTGRVTRATLSGSSDDPAVDAAIKEVLANLQLGVPPQGMPPSVTMNLQAQRPN